MFKNARVGDKIWSVVRGWGKIEEITAAAVPYPIQVRFDHINSSQTFTQEGKLLEYDLYPTLFWDEVKFTTPPPPARKLTQEEYLAEPERCPYCLESNGLHGDVFDVEPSGQAKQIVDCSNCGRSWTDVYQLVRYEEGTD